MSNRTAYVIFSDDIREEVGNKRSIMGIYGPQVLVPVLPITLARFCATTTLVFRKGDAPKKLAMEMSFRDSLISRGEIDADELAKSCSDLERDMAGEDEIFPKDDAPMGRITLNAIISPFVVTEPGRVIVTVETESERLRAGSTMVTASQLIR